MNITDGSIKSLKVFFAGRIKNKHCTTPIVKLVTPIGTTSKTHQIPANRNKAKAAFPSLVRVNCSPLGSIALGIGGCAATAESNLADSVAQAQSTADEAKTMAAEARDIALRAEQKADQALATANGAQSSADKALSEAGIAKQMAAEASEKSERMFGRSISK